MKKERAPRFRRSECGRRVGRRFFRSGVNERSRSFAIPEDAQAPVPWRHTVEGADKMRVNPELGVGNDLSDSAHSSLDTENGAPLSSLRLCS